MFKKALNFAVFIILVFVFPTIVGTASIRAEETFLDQQTKFSFTIPSELKSDQQISGQSQLIILLKPRNEHLPYPTFNVLKQAGSAYFSAANGTQDKKQVLSSYRLAGITDARITSEKYFEISNRTALRLDLSYSLQGRELHTVCILVSGRNQHFILTWIDAAANFTLNSSMLDNILTSVTLPVESSLPPTEASQSNLSLIALLTVSIVVISILWRFKNRRSKTNR